MGLAVGQAKVYLRYLYLFAVICVDYWVFVCFKFMCAVGEVEFTNSGANKDSNPNAGKYEYFGKFCLTSNMS